MAKLFAITTGAIAIVAISAFQPHLLRGSGTALAAAAPAQPAEPQMHDMAAMHQRMMAEQKAADEKLDRLVAAMNAATGDDKVAALALVVNELVQQQKSMHAHMAMMAGHMHRGMGPRGSSPKP